MLLHQIDGPLGRELGHDDVACPDLEHGKPGHQASHVREGGGVQVHVGGRVAMALNLGIGLQLQSSLLTNMGEGGGHGVSCNIPMALRLCSILEEVSGKGFSGKIRRRIARIRKGGLDGGKCIKMEVSPQQDLGRVGMAPPSY